MSYTEIQGIQKRLSALGHAVGILGWDNSVMMPPGGASGRADALGSIQEMVHEIITSEELGEHLESCESQELDEWQQANVRELRHQRKRAAAVPIDLLVAIEHAIIECDQVWRENRAKNDWQNTVEKLREVFNLTQQKADCLAQALSLSPYDALMDEYEPGSRRAFIDPIFTRLRAVLPDMIDNALARQPTVLPLSGDFPESAQMSLAKILSEKLGFDYSRGRIDTSHHPFSSGTVNDARLTTRHEKDSFLQSAFATFHETGHAMYTQGLPQGHSNEPAGEACGMMLHESQSLFMEMQVCRSNAFLDYFHPIAREHFNVNGGSEAWTIENFRNAVRKVSRDYIRVDADELTYPLHVMLRYHLETEFLAGNLSIDDLPDAWNEQMSNLLGLSTEGNYKDGVMQDTHWFTGTIGYFPTYTLGALAAAQFFEAFVRECGDPADDFREGRFEDVVTWLRENVHQRGRLLPSMDLIEKVTDAPLSADVFLRHLEKRYLNRAS